MLNIFTKFLDLNKREVDRLRKVVDQINSHEDKYKKFKLTDFKKETDRFKKLINDGKELESILPEAFALVREASKRILGKRHYDVQLMASVALFEGKVSEQKNR
jgi:preprotein translocase subunit SecA